jgi:hypothetical protein
VTQAQKLPREGSPIRRLWRFGLVRPVFVIGVIGMTLLQSRQRPRGAGSSA